MLATSCTSASTAPTPSTPHSAGGTVRLLYDKTVTSWDPQRMYAGPEGALALRMFSRTLTGYPAGGVGGVAALRGDLATDTGTPSDGGKTWTFTLRSGPTWQDGRPVTCQDVAYGIARSFARDQLPGGAPYPSTLLDIPSRIDASGREVPSYPGPYAAATAPASVGSTASASVGSTAPASVGSTAPASVGSTGTADSGSRSAEFDSAVSCQGATITIRLKVPVPDFPVIAALPVFAAFRQDHDRGGAGTFDVFSCGPYRLDGVWEPATGGRFVRNESWDRSADALRQGWPDVVDIREALPVETILQRLVQDKAPDNTAIGLTDLPASLHAGLLADSATRDRASNPFSGTVELLQPNVKSPVLENPVVRRALALATDREAFVAAYGGTVMTAASSALANGIPGHPADPSVASMRASAAASPTGSAPATTSTATDAPTSATASPTTPMPTATATGPGAARAVLVGAGVALPVRIRVAYRSSGPADAAYAALKAGWERAGFAVDLTGMGDDYYRVVSRPDAGGQFDVFRRSWFADYPSGAAVLPELFDGRANLTDAGTGQDLGSFNDDAVNTAIEAAQIDPDPVTRAGAWAAIDAMVSDRGGQIPLAERRRFFLRGSAVAGYRENPYLGGWVDLADIAVSR